MTARLPVLNMILTISCVLGANGNGTDVVVLALIDGHSHWRDVSRVWIGMGVVGLEDQQSHK